MSLYRKYRPGEFGKVVGNQDMVEYLERAIKEDSPHVFLLHGPTGCGKTTIARIIADQLGASGIDLDEINTANFRGIDTAREIIKQSRYTPMGKARVWIIDECHKLTTDAQNALLKLFEDTPEKAFFILCTTEPNKVLPTIKGRCIQLEVKLLNDGEMFRLLKSIVKAEGEKLKKIVYEEIIRVSFGLPRNAIQILERILNHPAKKRMQLVEAAAAELSESIELCRALMQNEPWKKVSTILKGLKEKDPESIRRHVLVYFQSVLLGRANDKAAFVIEEFQDPFYDSGFPKLVLACYTVIKG